MLRIGITLCLLVGASVYGQRVAPGVAPQHYQQQQPPQHQQAPPPPQYQQVHQQQQHLPPGVSPQQYQQQQVQYQQVPVHQQQQIHQQIPVQQQVPVQQVPVHQQQQVPVQQVPHGHGQHAAHMGHASHGQVLNAANIQHEKEHIQEHLHVPIDTSKMSEAELQFHYFKMHDSDNNNKLDGCELIKSLIHWHADEHKDKDNKTEANAGTGQKDGTTYTDDNLADVIDYVLSTMDLNKDGYVDYTEYRKSEEESAKGHKQ